jgi:hypothetical protein
MQEAVRGQLHEQLGISSAELESLAGLVRSDVELSLGDCLKSSIV